MVVAPVIVFTMDKKKSGRQELHYFWGKICVTRSKFIAYGSSPCNSFYNGYHEVWPAEIALKISVTRSKFTAH